MSKKPPYVKPVIFPNEIIRDNMSYDDIELLMRTIIAKQKTGAEWDNVRAKLPEPFLDKLKRILDDCWKNGFCNPKVREGKIVWQQITGRPFRFGEQCDLCRNGFIAGTCKGTIKYSMNGQRNFKKCWEK